MISLLFAMEPSPALFSCEDPIKKVSTSNNPMDYFSLLPREIKFHIFSSLTYQEVEAFSKVCKEWKDISQCPLFQKIILKNSIFVEELEAMGNRYSEASLIESFQKYFHDYIKKDELLIAKLTHSQIGDFLQKTNDEIGFSSDFPIHIKIKLFHKMKEVHEKAFKENIEVAKRLNITQLDLGGRIKWFSLEAIKGWINHLEGQTEFDAITPFFEYEIIISDWNNFIYFPQELIHTLSEHNVKIIEKSVNNQKNRIFYAPSVEVIRLWERETIPSCVKYLPISTITFEPGSIIHLMGDCVKYLSGIKTIAVTEKDRLDIPQSIHHLKQLEVFEFIDQGKILLQDMNILKPLLALAKDNGDITVKKRGSLRKISVGLGKIYLEEDEGDESDTENDYIERFSNQPLIKEEFKKLGVKVKFYECQYGY